MLWSLIALILVDGETRTAHALFYNFSQEATGIISHDEEKDVIQIGKKVNAFLPSSASPTRE